MSADPGRWLPAVEALAREAAAAILAVYEREDFGVSEKDDRSPLTEADLAAHRIIEAGLRALTPDYPVLSEESDVLQPWSERRSWSRHWLVDPLDGTREFVSRRGEFTVNIALIEQGRPVLGVVQVPVTGVLYAAAKGQGAWEERDGVRRRLRTRPLGERLVLAASRRSGLEAVDRLERQLAESLAPVTRHALSSSLKLCQVAAGTVDLYPRLAPTSEWDTAAAQVLVEEAGGCVTDIQLQPLRYQKEDLLNPWFLVLGDPTAPWQRILPLLAQLQREAAQEG